MELNRCYSINLILKHFIHILTASACTMFDTLAVRIGIASVLELTFVL